MQRIVNILAGAALALFLSTGAFAKDSTVTLKVKGWHCGGCASGTADKLKEVKGVKTVETSVEKSTAVVTYDDPATVAQLEQAIADAGYKTEK